MILFTLKCPADHRFEAWFKDGAAYEVQAERGLIACPVCASAEIAKAPMAPRISKGLSPSAAADTSPVEAETPPPDLIAALRLAVETSCENVGTRFAEEARRIHYGEAENRGIFGQAGPEDAQALQDEGIEVVTLPWPGRNG